MDVTGQAADEERIAGLGLPDVSVAGESVLLVLVVHLEGEGVLDVVGLDRVPPVVAQLVRRREALADGKGSIVTHVHGENNLKRKTINLNSIFF